jgi:pyruvate dehydrogenase E2 component (dihydrolipoamide acetyltransferase)
VPTDFTMPKLGLTMEEGTVLEWLVPDGADVAEGTPVLVVETDKVETEVNVAGGGRLHQLGEVGKTYACGEVIGLLLAEGEEAPERVASAGAAGAAAAAGAAGGAPPPAGGGATAFAPPAPDAIALDSVPSAPAAPGGRLLASPNARRVAAEAGVDLARVRGTGPGGRILSEDVEDLIAAGAPAATTQAPVPAAAGAPRAVAPAVAALAGGAIPASVAARQLADLLGVDLGAVEPDPGEGRVTREAVARHVRAVLLGAAATAPTVASTTAAPAELPAPLQAPTQIVPLRGMRGTIAKRMHSSLQQMAQLTLFMDADLDAVVADRAVRSETGTAPGYTDYVVAAAARALRAHPIVNAQVVDDGIALLPDIHVGLAVAVDDGLIVPVVRHADQLGLAALAAETRRLADAARTKSIPLEDLEGGTFSVSALGMFGVDGFTPVINPPNVAILGVGRLRDDVELADHQDESTDGHSARAAVQRRKRLTLSLTWDHRVLDGAPAAAFCREVARLLSAPGELD